MNLFSFFAKENKVPLCLLDKTTISFYQTRASDRAREIATRVPALHNLLNQIGRRHNKEGLILGAVIGVCVFLLWVFS